MIPKKMLCCLRLHPAGRLLASQLVKRELERGLLMRNLPLGWDRVNPTLKNLSRAELLGTAALLKRGAGAFLLERGREILGRHTGCEKCTLT